MSSSYVGTLHEINSESSTVALENVVSWGTEGRDPDNEVPPSETVYEYIVFRGSDVKDLKIQEQPKENKPPNPPQVPDDPAILGVSLLMHIRLAGALSTSLFGKMMKHFGCKSYYCTTESAKPCGYLPLPSF